MKSMRFNTKKYYVKYKGTFEFEKLQVHGYIFYTYSKMNYTYKGEGKCLCLQTNKEVLLTDIYSEIKNVTSSGNLIAKRKNRSTKKLNYVEIKRKEKMKKAQ